MKKNDLKTVIEIVRENKMKRLEIIYLMNTLQRAVEYPQMKISELWDYFKERSE